MWRVLWLSPDPKTPGKATGSQVYELEALEGGKLNPQRLQFINMLNGKNDKPVIPNIFPKFLKVSSHGTATVVPHLMEPIGKSLK